MDIREIAEMTHIICNQAELSLIKKAKVDKPIHLIRPLRDQPPEGYIFIGVMPHYKYGHAFAFNLHNDISHYSEYYEYVPIPYAPGDSLMVKETWRLHRTTNMRQYFVEYKDGHFRDVDYDTARKSSFVLGIWYSPTTMPIPFSRYVLTVTGEPSVKRVQELTSTEIKALFSIPKQESQTPQNWDEFYRPRRASHFPGQMYELLKGFKDYWNSRWKKFPWDANQFVVIVKVRSE